MKDVPGLLLYSEDVPFCQSTNSDLCRFLKKQYSQAFFKPNSDASDTTQMRDEMQDILLQSLKIHLTFIYYFSMFCSVEIKPNFSIFYTIIMDSDLQKISDHSPKNLLRLY